MKKVLILGLIFAAVGCSKEPGIDMDEVNKAAALAVLKGSYTTERGTTTAAGVPITIGTVVTIDTLNFSIVATDTANNLSFEYLELKEGWVVYKVTIAGAVKYTALGTGDGYIITEGTAFRATQDAVTFPERGTQFLKKQ